MPIAPDVRLAEGVKVFHPELVNLYGCTIGDHCKIAAFVEIQRGVVLGRRVKVEAFAFLPTGVRVDDGAFIGPHVVFTNDRYPRAVGPSGEPLGAGDWEVVPTVVGRGASVGANATIVCGVTIGEGALIGAGSTVVRDVPPHALVVGNPARVVRTLPPGYVQVSQDSGVSSHPCRDRPFPRGAIDRTLSSRGMSCEC